MGLSSNKFLKQVSDTGFLEQVSLSSFLKQVSQAASIKYLKGANVLAIVILFAWLSQLVKHMFQS